ncbi:MAG: endonuclease Q family protein [Candidatus Bathyarchaeota archaeon]|nr:endonuclease Q family protein [Candidatus Termiticorpusculum sp.]
MRVIADLHIHGRYSRATSSQMNLPEIALYSKIKGLNLVGTGDFTQPAWLKEIKQTLTNDDDTGLFRLTDNSNSQTRFMLTAEVCTIFDYKNNTKKVHHVILAPNFDVVEQLNEQLARFGNLSSDGRPILNMTASHLVEEVMSVSNLNMIFPAHAWTPWFSVFGAFSGFESIADCYQDMTKHIYAIETGLSSDPAMNWRLSSLDRFTLLSNSDCHSFWPWRIGREANVFELTQFTYNQIIDTIRTNDSSRLKFTIETDPAYGKYHWAGHRNCKVSYSPAEAIKFANICPVCRKRLTKGVEQRVEELADRPSDFKRENVPMFMHLLPLSEIISTVFGVNSPSTQVVWSEYNKLVSKFGNEYNVLIDASQDALASVVDVVLAETIVKVREGILKVNPGYDGIYGQLVLGNTNLLNANSTKKRVQQLNMADFFRL